MKILFECGLTPSSNEIGSCPLSDIHDEVEDRPTTVFCFSFLVSSTALNLQLSSMRRRGWCVVFALSEGSEALKLRADGRLAAVWLVKGVQDATRHDADRPRRGDLCDQ